MAEKETKNKLKDLIEPIPEELLKLEQEITPKEEMKKTRAQIRGEEEIEKKKNSLAAWKPRTLLGKLVKEGKIKDIDEILIKHKKILEAQIVDLLLPIETDLLLVGQSKGKFGGGKRRAWRQTQRKTMEGNVVSFSCMVVAGDKKGHIGIGFGKAKETLPARDKAIRNAKINVTKITLGFESVEENKDNPHTVPFKVKGKCGSVRIKLIPAPRGTGLVAGDECKKILRLAGIKDVYTVTDGQTRTTINMAKATIDALNKTNKMKL